MIFETSKEIVGIADKKKVAVKRENRQMSCLQRVTKVIHLF